MFQRVESQENACLKNTLERCKGHTHKGHREKALNVMNFRIFQGVFRVFSGYFQDFSGCFQGVFRVFFPMPFPGMPLDPFKHFMPSANYEE